MPVYLSKRKFLDGNVSFKMIAQNCSGQYRRLIQDNIKGPEFLLDNVLDFIQGDVSTVFFLHCEYMLLRDVYVNVKYFIYSVESSLGV